ncbi:hypothetical protein [Serratia sp. AKBS12]|uniref:hypothetical protein n=1 Tax=Serratia sp. AKBS12 TaxID=2974597 RepID=UPI00386401D9
MTEPVTLGELHVAALVASCLSGYSLVDVEVLQEERDVELPAAWVDVAIRIGKLKSPQFVMRRLAPCRMACCALPAYLTHYGNDTLKKLDDLLHAPSFGKAVSDGNRILSAAQKQSYIIDGTCRLMAKNPQLLHQ